MRFMCMQCLPFPFSRASSSPAKYVTLLWGLPSDVSLKVLSSTCCSQINDNDASPQQQTSLSMPRRPDRSVQLFCALTDCAGYENCTTAMLDTRSTPERPLPWGSLNTGVWTLQLVSVISHPTNIWPSNWICKDGLRTHAFFFTTLKRLSMNGT